MKEGRCLHLGRSLPLSLLRSINRRMTFSLTSSPRVFMTALLLLLEFSNSEIMWLWLYTWFSTKKKSIGIWRTFRFGLIIIDGFKHLCHSKSCAFSSFMSVSKSWYCSPSSTYVSRLISDKGAHKNQLKLISHWEQNQLKINTLLRHGPDQVDGEEGENAQMER